MTKTAQKRAIENYRSRLSKQGVARFEVLAPEADRDLIRSLAKRLSQNDLEANRIRTEIKRAVSGEPRKKGGIFAALRNSPLAGGNLEVDLEIVRSSETGRKVEL
jgi:hypothetical protein